MTYKLLLADDSVTIQRVIELTFAEENVRVITVGDGQAAIDRLESDPPDIVLADVDMPKRDGYQVAAYVKSRPKLAHIPVVLLTGAFEPIDQARATAAGSSDVLAKPFEPQMVINRVKQLLGRKREEPRPEPVSRSAEPSAAVLETLSPPSEARPPARSTMTLNDFTNPNPPIAEASGPEPGVSLDDYFDQLDAAFSNLQRPGSVAPKQESHDEDLWIDIETAHQGPEKHEAVTPKPEPKVVNFEQAHESVAEVLVSVPAPPDEPSAPLMAVEQSAPAPLTIDAVAPPLPVELPTTPSVAAVAAAPIEPEPAAAPSSSVIPVPSTAPTTSVSPLPQPVPAPPSQPRVTANPFAELSAVKSATAARPAAPVITDDLIDEVVARVLQRMTDRVVRETVTEIVSQTAERLVQEEILRIKNEGQ